MFHDILVEIIKQIDLAQIIAVIIIALFTPVIGILIKYLFIFIKSKIESVKSGAVRELIYFLVRAAQQKLSDCTNEAKLHFVIKQVQEKFPWLPEKESHDLIEAAVFELKQEMAVLGTGKKNTNSGSSSPAITGK